MIYKKIEGYDNYLVSNTGMILNVKRNKHLKNVVSDRYMIVLLYKNNSRKRFYVHRIVAEAFCERVEGKNCVNHKDLNKHNNDCSNLEWVSQKENVVHYINSDKYKPRKFSEIQKEETRNRLYKKVLCNKTKKIYKSIEDFAKERGISVPQASMKLNGKLKNNLNAILLNHFKKQTLW